MNTSAHPRADVEVLVAGAGPSGLTAALELARYGIGVRVVDRKPGPVRQARATIVHARTLEIMDRLGLAEQVVAQGMPITGVHVRDPNRLSVRLALADPGLEGRTRFPCALSLEQSETERILVEALAERGVHVEWDSHVEDVADTGGGVRTTVRRTDGITMISSGYLVAADGASSCVRRLLDIGFAGRTFSQTGLLADVELDGADLAPEHLRLHLTRGGFVGILPLNSGRHRLFGALPPGFARAAGTREISHEAYATLTEADLRRWFEDYFQVTATLRNVVFASLFRFHSRTARRFRQGNVFLVGDAAHIHNPAGGQGMNLGIGDAANLAWKLALGARGVGPDRVLASYQAERRPIAEKVTRNTDRGFKLETTGNPVAVWLRAKLAGAVAEPLSRLAAFRRVPFRLLSQTWIGYRTGPITAQGPRFGVLRGGDRAPHAPLPSTGGSVLDVVRTPGFHVLVFEGRRPRGRRRKTIADALAADRPFPVHVHFIPRSDVAAHRIYRAGRPRAVLVRPDGHIALISQDGPDLLGPVRGYLDHVLTRAGSPTAGDAMQPIRQSARSRRAEA